MATQWQPELEAEGKDAVEEAGNEEPAEEEKEGEKKEEKKEEAPKDDEKAAKDEPPARKPDPDSPGIDEQKLLLVLPIVKKDNPRAVSTTTDLWASFIKKNGQLSIDRFPLHHYLIQQCLLHCYDMLLKLKKMKLIVVDLRENIENLCYLSDLLKKEYKDMAFILSNKVAVLINMMAEFAPLMEKGSDLPQTDWKALSTWLRRKSGVEGKKIQDMVPKMNVFELGRLLGAGGFGAVYKASLGDVTCTIKFVPCSKLPSPKFACVDKVVATMINNPFLVKYYACFATVQAYITCMEFIKGVDLQKVLRAAKTFATEINTLVIAQLGSAVAHCHYKGFTHRDIKPANMLVCPGCRVKLIDFDTVKIFCGKFCGKKLWTYFRRTATEVLDGQRAGTPPYFAPEVIAKKAYGRSIDWWAVGITAYCQATGKVPFYSKDRDEMFKKIKTAKHTWPSDTPVDQPVKDFCDEILKKNPVERLCSINYNEFFHHPMFKDLNWEELATKPVLNDYKYILDCMKGGGGTVSPVASPAAIDKKKRLFPKDQFDDTKDQKPLFTYASPGFIRAFAEHRAGNRPTEETIYDKPVDFVEDAKNDYKFADFIVGNVNPPPVDPEDMPGPNDPKEDDEYKAGAGKSKNKKAAKDVSDGVPPVVLTIKRGSDDPGITPEPIEYRGADCYLAYEVKPGSPAEAGGVLQGDYLQKCNTTMLRGLTMDEVLAQFKEKEEFTLEVHPYNPFRILSQNADCCKAILSSKLTVRTWPLKSGASSSTTCQDFGFEMKSVAGKMPGTFFHIVTKAVDVVANEKGTRLFPGDIIRSVNDVDIPKDMETLAENIFKGHTGDTKISILPTSPVRGTEMKALHNIINRSKNKGKK